VGKGLGIFQAGLIGTPLPTVYLEKSGRHGKTLEFVGKGLGIFQAGLIGTPLPTVYLEK
jgi:hypothetical protein